MSHWLFVHFKEKSTPDGEQVYFSTSRDGLHWEMINGGQPVLWSFQGDLGVRDMTIIRDQATGLSHIFATDLSLAYGMRGKYHHSWQEISRNGSKSLMHWQSSDLVHWTEGELVPMGQDFGCVWAPDVIYDPVEGDYLLHWSSSHRRDDYATKCIWGCRTKDFVTYSEPKPIFSRPEGMVIDSAIYYEDGSYYLFIKSEREPSRVMLYSAPGLDGPWTRNTTFDEAMLTLQEGLYEAPTAIRLDDGRWCLFLDFYGVKGAGQGYVPFLAPSLRSGAFVRADSELSFPYHFKHGTVMKITQEEYDRIRAHVWEE